MKESTAHYLISLIWWDLGLCNCTLYFCVDNIFPSKETNLLTCKWDLQLNTCTCLRAKIHYLLLLLIKVSGKSLEIKLHKFFFSMAEIVPLECHRYLGPFSQYESTLRIFSRSKILTSISQKVCHNHTIGPYNFPIKRFVGFFIEKYHFQQIFFLHSNRILFKHKCDRTLRDILLQLMSHKICAFVI